MSVVDDHQQELDDVLLPFVSNVPPPTAPPTMAHHPTVGAEDNASSAFAGVLEDRGATSFSFSVFMFEFLTHVTYPLSIPLVVLFQGKDAAVAKGMLPGVPAPTFFQNFTTVLFLAPLVMGILLRDEQPWCTFPVAVATTLAWFRLLVVGGKYGSFSRDAYQRVLRGESLVVNSLLLFTWGATVPQELLVDELREAERTSGVDLKECFLRVTLEKGSETVWSCDAYARELVLATLAHPIAVQWQTWGPRIASAAITCFPIWKFVDAIQSNTSLKHEPTAIVLVILLSIETFFFGNIIFAFLGVGILHYHRLWLLRSSHCRVLRFASDAKSTQTSSVRREDAKDVLDSIDSPPRYIGCAPVTIPENLSAWMCVATVLSRFGGTFNRRVGFNCLAFATVCLILGGTLVLQIWLSGSIDISVCILISFLFISLVLLLVATALLASRANRCERRVLKALDDERLALLWCRHFAAPRGGALTSPPMTFRHASEWQLSPRRRPADIEELRDAIDIVMSALQRRLEESPLKIMFVAASAELVTFLLSVAMSGATLIVGLVLQTSGVVA